MIFVADHYSEVRLNDWPWLNFKPAEIASRGDGSIAIETDAMDALQDLRNDYGRGLVISSAYRDPIHNARVGGAPRSAHKLGLAFDLALYSAEIRDERHQLYEIARANGFRGFGFYSTFMHVDLSRRRQWYGGNRAREFWGAR